MINAPVHDLLIRIKNAYMARKLVIRDIMATKLKKNVLALLKQYNFITNFEEVDNSWKKSFIVHLHDFINVDTHIPQIKFYSKPSRRWYVSSRELKIVAWWQWIWIVSTNKWILASHVAKKKNIWWELIAEIY
mgnify:CR=1 FL=1